MSATKERTTTRGHVARLKRTADRRRAEYLRADAAARERKDEADRWLAAAIDQAREDRTPWTRIEEATEISRQTLGDITRRQRGD